MRSLPTRRNSPGLCAAIKKATCPTKFKGEHHTWEASQKRKIEICEQIESTLTRSDTGGRYPKGAVKKILNANIGLNPWLTRDMIKNLSKKRKTKKKALIVNMINVSLPIEVPPTIVTLEIATTLEPINLSPGRPTGTTDIALMECEVKFELMKDEIVLGWVDKSKRPKKKLLQEWILMKQ